MSERPVGELIGWTRTPSKWLDATVWKNISGGEEWEDPTVDDLLAWLRQHNWTSFHFGCEGPGYYVDWGDDAAHGDTMLGALEAAVRKVAERE